MPDSTISVVIANVNGLPHITECLAALERQQGHRAEIVVVDCSRDDSAAVIREKHSSVVLVEPAERLGIPEMRAIGMEHARGDVIAIIEDHCIVRPDWLAAIEAALVSGDADVIGGPIENACDERLVDRAVFLTEYSDMMPPVVAGPTEGVPGNNVAYRRSVFDLVRDSTLRYDWEYFIHTELREAGARFQMVPAMELDHKKEFGFFYFVTQRFHYSRSFAGMRRARVDVLHRLVYAAASPLLIPILMYRIGRAVRSKQRYGSTYVAGFPLLAAFMVSYAVGECAGYLFGGGRSIHEVE